MHISVPQMRRCCFCFPLRHGIMSFAIINMFFSLSAVICLVITTGLRRLPVMEETSLEVVTSTVLFTVLGMGVILNVLLLIAGYQKDITLLRLYNSYAAITNIVALIPTCILVTRLQLLDGSAAFSAIIMQSYVILLVRSEIVKLEDKLNKIEEEVSVTEEEIVVDISDRETLV